MVKKRDKWIKRNHIIRDMYDGRIISDKEAISKRNLDIIAEKEGLILVCEEEETESRFNKQMLIVAVIAFLLSVSSAFAVIDNSTMTNTTSGSGTTNGLGLVIVPNKDHLHLQNITFGVNSAAARLRIFDTNGTLLQEVSTIGSLGSLRAETNVTLRLGRSYAIVAGSSGAAHAYTASALPAFPKSGTNVNFTNRVWIASDGGGALNIDTAEMEEIQLVYTNETLPPAPPNSPPNVTNVSIVTPENPSNNSVTINFSATATDADNTTLIYRWSLHNGSIFVTTGTNTTTANISAFLGTYLVTFNQTFNLTVNVTDGINTVSRGATLNQTIDTVTPEPPVTQRSIFYIDLSVNSNLQMMILIFVIAILLILFGFVIKSNLIYWTGSLLFAICGFVLLTSGFNGVVSGILTIIGLLLCTQLVEDNLI